MLSQEVLAAQASILASIKRRVTSLEAQGVERPISTDKCRQALFALGVEKSPVWDVISMEFFQKFWQNMSEPVCIVAKKAFEKGKMEADLSKGFIKPIPKQVSCSLLKHWTTISMMTVLYTIIAEVIATRLSPTLDKVVTPH